jgi:hypothetical protein
MKRIFPTASLLVLLILCSIHWGCEPRETGGPNGLKVTVDASKATVRVGGWFDVTLRVKNEAPTNQYFFAWNCSWSDNWKSDNTNVVLAPQLCTRNFPALVDLKPDASYSNDGKMSIVHPVPGNRVTFRMGFTPCVVTN